MVVKNSTLVSKKISRLKSDYTAPVRNGETRGNFFFKFYCPLDLDMVPPIKLLDLHR